MTEHQQTELRVGPRHALVDAGIAPLIEQLWLAGIGTDLSCEENKPGIAWIDFTSPRDARRFLNIVARYDRDEDSLYDRAMRGEGHPSPAWTYDLHLWDYSLVEDDEDETHLGRPAFHFSVSVRFPRSDMPVLLARLIRHNSRRSRQRVHAALFESGHYHHNRNLQH